MSPWLILSLAFRALMRNRVRTALTMLGIVIGIASVIAMVAIGQGASIMLQEQMNSMGRNLLMVWPSAISSGGISWGAGSVQTLSPEDGDAIEKEVSGVRAVTPVVQTRAQVIYGSMNWGSAWIYGVGIGFQAVREWLPEEGNFFTEQDVAAAAKVCVLGKTVVDNLFQGEPPVGQTIRIKNMPFKVVGTLTSKGTNTWGRDQDDVIVLPWTTVKRVLQGSAFRNVEQLFVTATSAAAIQPATEDMTLLLRQRHRIRPGEESDFRIIPMTEMARTQEQQATTMTMLLAIIASISLVVGGIGIMNIMLVSVVERTREIGLRMAVGARGRDILLQFLMEAVALALVAGILGMFLGAGAAEGVSRAMHWPAKISPESVGISLLFSCGVGVFFGFYPALRASRLDPIEALRYE